MRAYVFTDRALEGLAGRCVWLALDTEKDVNAPAVEHLAMEGWPTLFIVDPRTEKVLIRRLGSATVAQVRELVEAGERAYRGADEGWCASLAEADRLYGEAKDAEAATAYAATIAAAPADWTERGRAIESYLFALQGSDQYRPCATLARDFYPSLKDTAAGLNVAATGLDCALSLPPDEAERPALIAAMEAPSRAVLANPKLVASTDDRSGVYMTLLAARQDAKDDAGARAVALEWSRFLDEAAAKAPTPEARAVFDSHRLAAYEELGQVERAVPMLEASERDLPGDYNPPARLAIAFKDLKRYDEALAASDRALARIYGPRRLTVLRTRAEIFVAKGDLTGARAVLSEALRLAAALPDGPRKERLVAGFQKQLDALQ